MKLLARTSRRIGRLITLPGLLLGGALLGSVVIGGVRHKQRTDHGAVIAHMETAVRVIGSLGEDYQATVPLQVTVVTPPPPHPHPHPRPRPARIKTRVIVPVIRATAKVPALSLTGVERIIYLASQKYGVSYPLLLSVARCESTLNPLAVNRSSGASGLFQFMPSTFSSHGGTNIWDPVQQANIAAQMFAAGESSAWACS